MSRIEALDPERLTGSAHSALENVRGMLGAVPNLFRVAANAPTTALRGLIDLNIAVSQGRLDAQTRAAIALTVAESNGCDYCLSAHSALGKRAGMSDTAIAGARSASAVDTKTAAILSLARAIVTNRGRVSDPLFDRVRRAGVGDDEILEVVSNVVLNLFTNYLNLLAETEIDFPVVKSLPATR
jgi:uncharacterized peroxidase-related enzyme